MNRGRGRNVTEHNMCCASSCNSKEIFAHYIVICTTPIFIPRSFLLCSASCPRNWLPPPPLPPPPPRCCTNQPTIAKWLLVDHIWFHVLFLFSLFSDCVCFGFESATMLSCCSAYIDDISLYADLLFTFHWTQLTVPTIIAINNFQPKQLQIQQYIK